VRCFLIFFFYLFVYTSLDYEVRYEAKKIGRSASAVKKAVKKVGNSRKTVERKLAR